MSKPSAIVARSYFFIRILMSRFSTTGTLFFDWSVGSRCLKQFWDVPFRHPSKPQPV